MQQDHGHGRPLVMGGQDRTDEHTENDGIGGGLCVLGVIVFLLWFAGRTFFEWITEVLFDWSPFAIIGWAMVIGSIIMALHVAYWSWMK